MLKEVVCISIRETIPTQITEGEIYLLDTDFLESDPDGDWYAPIYDKRKNYISKLNIKHFCAV